MHIPLTIHSLQEANISYHYDSKPIHWEPTSTPKEKARDIEDLIHRENIDKVLIALGLSSEFDSFTGQAIADAAEAAVRNFGAPSQLLISPAQLKALKKFNK